MIGKSTSAVPEPQVPYPVLVGRVVKSLRAERKIDQASMAQALSLTQSAYSRIESGDTAMSIWQLRLCALVLHVAPSDLLRRVEVLEHRVATEGIEVVAERRTNPRAALIGIAILAALMSS